MSKRSLQNSPLESSYVVVALVENYGTSKPLRVSPEKSQILSFDTVVANGRYVSTIAKYVAGNMLISHNNKVERAIDSLQWKNAAKK